MAAKQSLLLRPISPDVWRTTIGVSSHPLVPTSEEFNFQRIRHVQISAIHLITATSVLGVGGNHNNDESRRGDEHSVWHMRCRHWYTVTLARLSKSKGYVPWQSGTVTNRHGADSASEAWYSRGSEPILPVHLRPSPSSSRLSFFFFSLDCALVVRLASMFSQLLDHSQQGAYETPARPSPGLELLQLTWHTSLDDDLVAGNVETTTA